MLTKWEHHLKHILDIQNDFKSVTNKLEIPIFGRGNRSHLEIFLYNKHYNLNVIFIM